jgi:hypothetical protein
MILLRSLSEGASSLVQDCNTTYKMVERLLAQYDSSSASSVLFKFNKALDLSYQEGSNMSDHLGKLNSITNQIKSAGDITIENLHVVLRLRSIPETSNWKAVIENLKSQDEADLTKEKVARVLMERAAELVIKQVNKQMTELTLAVNSPSHTICYQHGKTGCIARFCRSKGSRQKTKPQHTAFGGASKVGKNLSGGKNDNELSDFDSPDLTLHTGTLQHRITWIMEWGSTLVYTQLIHIRHPTTYF